MGNIVKIPNMVENSGIGFPMSGVIENSESSVGITFSNLMIGGYQEFSTIEDRDKLPVDISPTKIPQINFDQFSSGRRRVGMTAHIVGENKDYRLVPFGFFGNGGEDNVQEWLDSPVHVRVLSLDPRKVVSYGSFIPGHGYNTIGPITGTPENYTVITGTTISNIVDPTIYSGDVVSPWVEIVAGDTIKSVTFSGTTQYIEANNGNIYETDINWVQLMGNQFQIGISNHSFQRITYPDFDVEDIDSVDYNVSEILYGSGIDYPPAKINIVVIDLTSSDDMHHIVELPQDLNENECGVIYKIIVKENNMSEGDKNLMLYSENQKIYSSNTRTEVDGSYFFPLETLESVELIWDGFDYIVFNMVKQEYVSQYPQTFENIDNEPYILRDPNELL